MIDLQKALANEFSRRGWVETYARHKPTAGQGSLFREEDHPRSADGEFARKGTGEGGGGKAEGTKQPESLAGQKDLFGGETAKGSPASPKAAETPAGAKQRQTTLFHGLGDARGQKDLFDLDYQDNAHGSQSPDLSANPETPAQRPTEPELRPQAGQANTVSPAAATEKERQLHADYLKLCDQFKLSGKLELEPWLKSYREQQAKVAPKANPPAASPAPPATAPAPEPAAPVKAPPEVERKISQRKKIVEDFGEKIGGARKDTARKLGPRREPKKSDDRPGWMRRYQVSQIAKSRRPEEEGKWVIHDTKTSNWAGQHRQVGSMVFATQAEAEAAIPLAEVARNHTTMGYRDAQGQTRYAIVRRVGEHKRPIVKAGFASDDEARRYMAVNPTEIIEHQFPRYETFQYLDHVERTGGAQRSGDVRPKEFHTQFGFRGGEFGNWQHGQEGQVALNHAYDALHDLADVLNLPPRGVSLNGQLAIAFGARGTGGKMAARAHYESDKRVINLTKMYGAGSLAHEWSHALDYYFGAQADGGAHPEAPSAASHGLPYRHNLRPEVATAWKDLVDTLHTKQVTTAIDAGRAETGKGHARKALAERLEEVDRSLESQRSYNKRFKPFTAEQQAEWDRLKQQVMSGDVGTAKWVEGRSQFGGYHTYEPLEKMNALYKAATGRSFHTADRRSVGSSIYWQVQHAADMDRRAREAGEGKTETRRQRTEYFQAATRMDTTRESNYYTIPTEMVSRAFEAYVSDKLAEQQRKSDYLVGKADNKYYRIFELEPFPEGEERTAINGAFDRFFTALRHETAPAEKGGHVRLYARGRADLVQRFARAFAERGWGEHDTRSALRTAAGALVEQLDREFYRRGWRCLLSASRRKPA